MFERLRHLGLQRRIMLFVAAGLSAMFGTLAVLGLGAIDQATQLVFRERLSTAYTTAAILDQDLGQIAADTREEGDELALILGSTVKAGAAGELLTRLADADTARFFRVTGVWIVSRAAGVLDIAGVPGSPTNGGAHGGTIPASAAALLSRIGDEYVVGRPVGTTSGGVAFASIGVPLAGDPDAPVALVHLDSINTVQDYSPVALGGPGPSPSSSSGAGGGGYHLEVVDPDGVAVLGIGSDERPGEPSFHFPRIRALMADGAAAALLHEPGPGESFEPHVMAVVPLPSTQLYVVLEQPIDVALALPRQLQERLFLTIAVGFILALLVAWVTTRHVVTPTEKLTAAAGRMAAGDLASPIDVRADDEIGYLADSLEMMRRQLAAARRELEDTNRELEVRVADRTARLNQLLGQTINAQEEERRRLARELHDETAQTLAALTITLDRARDELRASSPDAASLIAEARTTAARLLAETRRLILGLRPAVLDDLGLLPAIRWYTETTLVGDGIDVSIEADDPPPRLAPYLEVALFRIVQEAITNIARHAHASHATIQLAFDPSQVTVTVADDGIGFDIEGAAAHARPDAGRVGLIGMQERVRLLNGEMAIQSSTSGGTTIVVRVPLGSEERQ